MTPNPFLTRAVELSDQMIAWRRQIHQNPELSFQEVETAKLVAENLAAMGIESQTGVGKTGVVGYLGEGSPVVGIRAGGGTVKSKVSCRVSMLHPLPYVIAFVRSVTLFKVITRRQVQRALIDLAPGQPEPCRHEIRRVAHRTLL